MKGACSHSARTPDGGWQQVGRQDTGFPDSMRNILSDTWVGGPKKTDRKRAADNIETA
jgi:hypothetical protein